MVKHHSNSTASPLVTVEKANCFNSFQTVKKTGRARAAESVFVKDVIVTHPETKVMLGWGDIKNSLFFVCHVTLSNWDTRLVSYGCYSKFSQTWWLKTFLFSFFFFLPLFWRPESKVISLG